MIDLLLNWQPSFDLKSQVD